MLELPRSIPEFPDFKDIALEDKPVFDELFTRFPPVISEFTFTNLFIWRYAYQMKVSRFQNFLCLLSDRGKDPFFFPTIGEGDVIECYRMLLRYLEQKGGFPTAGRVPETVVNQINWEAAGMAAELDRSQCDYVYLALDLILLQGRRYHRKRNHIKQFKEKYSYQYIPISPEWIPECLRMEREWCNLRNCEVVPGLVNESVAIKEVFTHFEKLNIKGGAILINGKVEAFTFGEPLNPETVVIHIEKANSDYEGLYAVIHQAFLENHWSAFRYVNREQDLGEEGLRKAKESYFPHHMINKYRITLR